MLPNGLNTGQWYVISFQKPYRRLPGLDYLNETPRRNFVNAEFKVKGNHIYTRMTMPNAKRYPLICGNLKKAMLIEQNML